MLQESIFHVFLDLCLKLVALFFDFLQDRPPGLYKCTFSFDLVKWFYITISFIMCILQDVLWFILRKLLPAILILNFALDKLFH